MGFLKNLFGKSSVSEQKKPATRSVSQNSVAPQKAVEKTPEEIQHEHITRWARINEIGDVRVRIRQMEELAYSGFDAAFLTLADYYMELADITGTIQWNKVNHCLEKACEADLPRGHFLMALTRFNKDNPYNDVDRAIDELVIAVGMGSEEAMQKIVEYGTPADASNPEAVSIAARNKEMFEGELEPIVEELLTKEESQAWDTLGYLYFYGVYFERDFAKAKEYFVKANNYRMMHNPIFDMDDEDEDED